MSIPERVAIFEVGPRDGLQNEPQRISTAKKLEFIKRLADSGLANIEATSFVSPRHVPQLADADEVAKNLPKKTGVRYFALVPNLKGLRRAAAAGMQGIAVFTAASETFVKKNINMTIAESLSVFSDVIREAKAGGLSARGYVSTGFVCPYEGKIRKEKVREIAERLLELGVSQVSLGDTVGAAAPNDILETVGYALETIPAGKIALHLHDTYGTGLANAYAALGLGIAAFDTSAGGLGGCPYAPGASGNLATEDLLYMLNRMGIETGVDITKVFQASNVIAAELKHPLPSRQWRLLNSKNASQKFQMPFSG